MRSLLVGLVGLMSLWAASAWAAPEPVLGPPADWVKPLGPLKLDAPKTAAPYRQLRLDQQVHFGPEGDSVYVESVVRIQTAQGLSVMGTIALPWNPDSVTLTVHKLEIRRGDQVIDVLADQAFTVLRRENRLEYAMLDGVLTATIQPEGIEVGDIITLAFTMTRNDSVTGDFSENYIPAISAGQVDQVQLRVLWDPKAKPIRWRLVQGMNPPKVGKTRSGETELLFDLKSQTDYKPPAGAPARFLRGRAVEFTQFDNWAQISGLLSPLYDKAATLGPNSRLRAEVDKIRAASNDPRVQAGMALALVQDRTRYVFLGMDAGNLTPAAADATWARRYGDCKAKTALLLALLRELGIKAEPAVVHSENGDGMDERLPMVGLFDHVIVRAEIEGEVYWLDGTRSGDKTLADLEVPDFHWALPLRASGGALEALKPLPPPQPQMTLDVDIDATAGLYVKAPFKASQIFRGDMARELGTAISAVPAEDVDKNFKDYWAAMFGFVEVDKTTTVYDAASGEFRLTMEGKAEMGWSETSTSSAVRYLTDGYLLGGTVSYKREDGTDNIDAPYAVEYPMHVLYRETIRLPDGGKGYSVDGKDENRVVGGVSYYRKSEIRDGVFIMEARGRSLAPEFPASEAKAVEKAMAEMGEVKVYVVGPVGYRWTRADRDARIAEMDKAIAKDPKSDASFRARGWLNMENKDYGRAEADYTAAIALKDDVADYYTLRGSALFRQGKAEAAMADYATARKKAGKDAGSLNGLCWEQATNNVALESALSDCDAALQIEPRTAAILDSRGFVLMRLGRWSDSIADYDKAISIRSDTPETLFGRGLARYGAGDQAGGEADIAAARKLDPGIDDVFAGYGLKAPTPATMAK